MARTIVYVSAATAGSIERFELNESTGKLLPMGGCDTGGAVMPTAAHPGGKYLYAVIRSDPQRIITYAIAPDDGALTPIAEAPLPASMPYITATADGRWLLTASYASDCIAVLPIDLDGAARRAPVQTIPTGRHAHAIITDHTGQFVFVPCLGSGEILIFRRDAATGSLTPINPRSVAVPQGFGPRHAVMSPDNKHLYVNGEFTGEVAMFRFDSLSGTLEMAGISASVPNDSKLRPGALAASRDANTVWSADVKTTPDGRFMYVSERTNSTITLMMCKAADTALEMRSAYPTERQPRGIAVNATGTFLIVSGELSDHVASYAINQRNGALEIASRAPVAAGANWVTLVTLS